MSYVCTSCNIHFNHLAIFGFDEDGPNEGVCPQCKSAMNVIEGTEADLKPKPVRVIKPRKIVTEEERIRKAIQKEQREDESIGLYLQTGDKQAYFNTFKKQLDGYPGSDTSAQPAE